MSSELVDSVINAWWYYGFELKPGVMTKNYIPLRLPMLPRMLLKGAELDGMDCLDVGCMEGLIPVLMRRGGARRVLGIDAVDHCREKIAAVKFAYGVEFDFRRVGLMYDLSAKLADQGGFDLINFAGVNYHVYSPMHCIAGLRPLLRKNGLMIIATNVVNLDGHFLEFNFRGNLQGEANTFWYHSVQMMEYMARYFRLIPIDCLYFPNSPVNPYTYVPGRDAGYLAMVCRAVTEDEVLDDDAWAKRSRSISWEFQGLCNPAMMDAQPRSVIEYHSPRVPVAPAGGIELLQAIRRPAHIVTETNNPQDTHVLRLSDQD